MKCIRLEKNENKILGIKNKNPNRMNEMGFIFSIIGVEAASGRPE